MNRKGMQNIFVKRLSGLLCAWLFPFAALYAQVDTTTYHQLSGVEVLGKVRPSTTRESTPLQVMDKAGIERLGVCRTCRKPKTLFRCDRTGLRRYRRF